MKVPSIRGSAMAPKTGKTKPHKTKGEKKKKEEKGSITIYETSFPLYY